MNGSTGFVCSSTSSYFPQELVNVMKGEVTCIGRERRTRTFAIEYRAVDGVLVEARLRSRERVIVVPLICSS